MHFTVRAHEVLCAVRSSGFGVTVWSCWCEYTVLGPRVLPVPKCSNELDFTEKFLSFKPFAIQKCERSIETNSAITKRFRGARLGARSERTEPLSESAAAYACPDSDRPCPSPSL
jgi:hypothetical protein